MAIACVEAEGGLKLSKRWGAFKQKTQRTVSLHEKWIEIKHLTPRAKKHQQFLTSFKKCTHFWWTRLVTAAPAPDGQTTAAALEGILRTTYYWASDENSRSRELILALQKCIFIWLQAANHSASYPIKATTKPISSTCPFRQRHLGRYSMFSPSLEGRCLPAPPLSRAGLEVQRCPVQQITHWQRGGPDKNSMVHITDTHDNVIN